MATKDTKNQKSEFPSPGGWEVSREVRQKFKHCITVSPKIAHLGSLPVGRTTIPRQKKDNHFLARGDHPNSQKNAPRMEGQMKIFHVGSHQFRELLRELLRELWASCCSSRGMPFRERNFVFREWNFGIFNSESCSENIPELSESSENGLFTPRALFP